MRGGGIVLNAGECGSDGWLKVAGIPAMREIPWDADVSFEICFLPCEPVRFSAGMILSVGCPVPDIETEGDRRLPSLVT